MLLVHLIVYLSELAHKETFPDLFLPFNRLVTQADGIKGRQQQPKGQYGKRE